MSVDLNHLNGRIITFESKRFPGWFIDSRDKARNDACMSMLPADKRVDPNKPESKEASKWPQWIVRVRERDDRVSFESVERPDHYLDLTHYKGHGSFNKVKITWVSQLEHVGRWGQFEIKGNMDDATIQSKRWSDRYLCAQKKKKVMGGQGPTRFDNWGGWIISDLFAGGDKQVFPKNIVDAEWVDTGLNLRPGEKHEITVGMSETKGVANTRGSETRIGFSQEYGWDIDSLGSSTKGSVTVDTSTALQLEQTMTFETSTMRERTVRMVGLPGTKESTPFFLRVDFDDGTFMNVINRMVPSDRDEDCTFNPLKVPEMLPNSGILAAIEGVLKMS